MCGWLNNYLKSGVAAKHKTEIIKDHLESQGFVGTHVGYDHRMYCNVPSEAELARQESMCSQFYKPRSEDSANDDNEDEEEEERFDSDESDEEYDYETCSEASSYESTSNSSNINIHNDAKNNRFPENILGMHLI